MCCVATGADGTGLLASGIGFTTGLVLEAITGAASMVDEKTKKDAAENRRAPPSSKNRHFRISVSLNCACSSACACSLPPTTEHAVWPITLICLFQTKAKPTHIHSVDITHPQRYNSTRCCSSIGRCQGE